MSILNNIEELLVRDLHSLCTTCTHFEFCAYRKNAGKIVIECEMFETLSERAVIKTKNDLCTSCSKAAHCNLPKGPSGVWHCENYE